MKMRSTTLTRMCVRGERDEERESESERRKSEGEERERKEREGRGKSGREKQKKKIERRNEERVSRERKELEHESTDSGINSPFSSLLFSPLLTLSSSPQCPHAKQARR